MSRETDKQCENRILEDIRRHNDKGALSGSGYGGTKQEDKVTNRLFDGGIIAEAPYTFLGGGWYVVGHPIEQKILESAKAYHPRAVQEYKQAEQAYQQAMSQLNKLEAFIENKEHK